jgi:DNA replication initiation complex subunit (GINS family)
MSVHSPTSQPTPMPEIASSQTSSFQAAIELVEALTEEEQDLLFSLIQKRRIADRRQEILRRSIEVQKAFEDGTAKVGAIEDLLADVFDEEDHLGRRFSPCVEAPN